MGTKTDIRNQKNIHREKLIVVSNKEQNPFFKKKVLLLLGSPSLFFTIAGDNCPKVEKRLCLKPITFCYSEVGVNKIEAGLL